MVPCLITFLFNEIEEKAKIGSIDTVAIRNLKKIKEAVEISCKANLINKKLAPQNKVAIIINNVGIYKESKKVNWAYSQPEMEFEDKFS